MIMEGWINLHRQILESAVFASEKRLKIWIWLLCKTNYKDRFINLNIGRGESIIELKRGQVLFGRFKAEEETGINGSTVYKILHWFESEKMIEIKSNSHYTILTISNYNDYQTMDNQKVTSNEQASNNQVTANEQASNTPNKDKKDNKDKNDNKVFIAPQQNEVEQYFFDNGYTKQSAIKMFNYYSVANWKDGKGNQVKNWKQKSQSVWFKDENKLIKTNEIKPTYIRQDSDF
jgi:hypothetical protein